MDIEAIMFSRLFTNLIIGLLSLWAIYSIVSTAFGVFVVFPLRSVDSTGVPDGRLQSIRLAVLATFAFYGVMHLIQGSKEVYPIHFLKCFLFFLGTMGGLFGVRKTFEGVDVFWTEWTLVIFWLLVSVVLHFTSTPRYKRYFSKK